jgi:hypothetical protein
MSETDTMPAPSAMHTASTGSAGTYATPGALGSTYAAGQVSVAREGVREEVCGRKTFTQVEDRPVTRERVETIVEHRPVEKQYVTEVRCVRGGWFELCRWWAVCARACCTGTPTHQRAATHTHTPTPTHATTKHAHTHTHTHTQV